MQEFMFKYVEEDDSYCAMSYRGDEAEVTVPAMHWGRPVTMLYDDLFKGHTEITAVRLPDTIREIGGFVFDGCNSLTHIDLPAGLVDLWQYAFVRSSVEEIVLPEGVRYIVPFTFKDCRRLRRVICNKGLLKIWMSAFEGCDSLVELRHDPDVEIV